MMFQKASKGVFMEYRVKRVKVELTSVQLLHVPLSNGLTLHWRIQTGFRGVI